MNKIHCLNPLDNENVMCNRKMSNIYWHRVVYFSVLDDHIICHKCAQALEKMEIEVLQMEALNDYI